MRHLLVSVMTALVTAALAAPVGARATTNCGTFTSAGAAVYAKVTRGRTDCLTARRVLRRYLSSTAPCSGSACVRRHTGWVCATATVTAFPRLASCSRSGRVIAAYSTAASADARRGRTETTGMPRRQRSVPATAAPSRPPPYAGRPRHRRAGRRASAAAQARTLRGSRP
jgi:hypothetical protein